MSISRDYLIERVQSFLQNSESRVLIVSGPPGGGKSTALKPSSLLESCVCSFSFEFQGKPASSRSFLAELMRGMIARYPQHWPVLSKAQPGAFNDPQSLFEKHFLKFSQKICEKKKICDEKIFVILDSPERALDGELLWDLAGRRWAEECGVIKLVIITQLRPEQIPCLVDPKVEFLTRLSKATIDRDEAVRALLAREMVLKGVDVEWDHDRLDVLTKQCAGNLLLAQLVVWENDFVTSKQISKSLPEAFEKLYKPELAPLLCARRAPLDVALLIPGAAGKSQLVALLAKSNACKDWFNSKPNRERARIDGHVKLVAMLSKQFLTNAYAASHCAYHALEAFDLETARSFFVQFDYLFASVRAGLDLLVEDLESYLTKRPGDMTVRVVYMVLIQSKRGLRDDPRQLPFQLLGRLSGVASDAKADFEISKLLNAARNFRSKEFSWFRPIRASMQCPPEQTLKVFKGHTDSILAVACTGLESVAPRLALTGSSDGTSKLYDLQTGRCELTLDNLGAGYCSSVALFPITHQSILALTGSQDGNTRLWYLSRKADFFQSKQDEPDHVFIGHAKEITGCCFSPNDAALAATCSADRTAKLWHLPLPGEGGDPVCLQTLQGHEHIVLCVRFLIIGSGEDESLLLTGSKDHDIRLWSAMDGRCIRSFPGHFSNVTCLAVSSDCKLVASGGWDCIAKVWTTNSVLGNTGGEVVEKCSFIMKDWIWSVAFLENPTFLATATENGVVRLFNVNTKECVLSFDGHLGMGVYCMAAMGNDYLITGGNDSTMRLFDVGSQRQSGNSGTGQDGGGARRRAADVASWSDEAEYRHSMRVTCVAFPAQSLKKQFVFTGSEDKTIRVFDLATGRQVKKLQGAHESGLSRILVSRDGNRLKSIDVSNDVAIWNRSTFEMKKVVKSKRSLSERLSCVSLSFAQGSEWVETGVSVDPKDGGVLGKFAFVMPVMAATNNALPFATCTFDHLGLIDAWRCPAMELDGGASGTNPFVGAVIQMSKSFRDVFVVAERDGNVHILYPMCL